MLRHYIVIIGLFTDTTTIVVTMITHIQTLVVC